jgi:tetratricopeptide (TPR) repeat protein
MDLDNPVIQLCQQGMRAEAEGSVDEAQQLFEQAWRIASDDYEACVAAHYLARHQADPQQSLHWNEECLRRADLVGDERVAGFYPSLHLSLAHTYADLGRPEAAIEHFRLAARHLDRVPVGPYGDWMRLAVADGLRRSDTAAVRPMDEDLAALVDRILADLG